MLDLAAPEVVGTSLIGYRDEDDPAIVYRLPDQLVLARRSDGVPDLGLTLLRSAALDGGILVGTWALAAPRTPESEAVDVTPVRAHVRLTAVLTLGEAPVAQAWQPVPVPTGRLEVPPLIAEPSLATLLVEQLDRGSLDGVVSLDAVIDVPARRLELHGRLTVQLEALHGWVGAAVADSTRVTRALLHSSLGAFVDQHRGALWDIELDEPVDETLLREELVLTLLEQGRVEPVTGDLGRGADDDVLTWNPVAPIGRFSLELGGPRVALLRRDLTASISDELLEVGVEARQAMVRRTSVPPMVTTFSLAVTNLLPSGSDSVGALVVRVRRRVGNRFEDLRHDFAAPGARQSFEVDGRRFLVHDAVVRWEAELIPGPTMRAAGIEGVRRVGGALEVERHGRLLLDAATFGLDGVTLDVDPSVAAALPALVVELRAGPEEAPILAWESAPTGGWFAVDAAAMPSAPHLRVLADRVEDGGEPIPLLDIVVGPLRRVHLTPRQLLGTPFEVMVQFADPLPPSDEVDMVTVLIDSGDPATATRIVVQPGDPPRRWRHPRRTVLVPCSWWWSEEWLLSTPRGRQLVPRARREGVGDRIVLSPPP